MNKQIGLKKQLNSRIIFLLCAVIVIYCPFLYVNNIGDYIGDTIIQTKIGLDCLKNHTFIPVEIYSWHENLNWVTHEIGWYYLVGIAYKLFGLFGIIGVSALINYSIAVIGFKHNYDNNVHPLVIVVAACLARFLTFPSYNARPNLFTQLAVTVLFYALLSEKSLKRKCVTFIVASFLVAWFHGGLIVLPFIIMFVVTVIELIFKNYKAVKAYLISLLVGFGASLLNPNGIEIWTYSFKRNGPVNDYYISFVNEWQPKTFSMLEIAIILLILIGFAVDKRLRDFDKNTIIRLCFFCMFIIMSCKYCRLMNYTALVVLLFCAEEIQILIEWVNNNTVKIDKDIFDFSDTANNILSVFCVGFAVFITVTSINQYFPTNTMSDISAIEGYDEGVIDCVNEHGYRRIYNDFDTGTWLAFYDVPVHIDNRSDLYMPQYSGVDYITGQMIISNIGDMDWFYEQYSPDALVLQEYPGTVDELFVEDLIESDRYTLVYDNLCQSVYDENISYRWLVFECNY
ncbi:MAG: hypothetical protein MJ094_05980 [Saccharofermentans sp.]|nr:hypothetical protein [Saccharofermentans sp.]